MLPFRPPIVRRTYPVGLALSLEWAWGDGAPSLLLARGAETTLDPIRRERNGPVAEGSVEKVGIQERV